MKIWQNAVDISVHVYNLCKNFPADEKFNLISQIKRAAVSIPSNIAEGSSRDSNKDFARYLNIALGSSRELQTQMIISNRLNFIQNKDFHEINESIEEVQKMITGFKKNLTSSF
jgi:four helix bundle protein